MQEMEVAEEKKIGMNDRGMVEELNHRFQFTAATRHPMLLSIRDGWYKNIACLYIYLFGTRILFVRGVLFPFVDSVMKKARKESDDSAQDIEVISRGMASLEDEISWIEKEAVKWGISLSTILPQQANTNYIGFLENLTDQDVEYTVAITAFWAIETVYHESFAHCLEEGSKTPEQLKETCARWGNEGFGLDCQFLQKIVNRCSQKASDDELKKAEVVLLRVLELKVEFWNMSYANV